VFRKEKRRPVIAATEREEKKLAMKVDSRKVRHPQGRRRKTDLCVVREQLGSNELDMTMAVIAPRIEGGKSRRIYVVRKRGVPAKLTVSQR